MKKTCLLFDNDGTLVDSEYLCNLCIAEEFAAHGINITLSVDELVRQYRGMKMSDVLATLAQLHQATLPSNFIDSYRKRVTLAFEQHLQPVANVTQALQQLPHAKAVVSNGPIAKIEQSLNLCNLRQFFGNNLYSAYQLGVYKPDPEIYLLAAQKMGVSKDQCVVIEDSLTGVEAASRAGISTLFYNHLHEQHDLPQVTDFYDMADLPELIAAMS